MSRMTNAVSVVRAERVRALTRQGHSLNEIAAFLGITKRQVERLRQLPPPPAPQLPDVRNQPWTERAECARYDAELWFATNDTDARAVCEMCPVLEQCRAYVMALEGGSVETSRFGIWAGMDPHERWLVARRQKRAAS